MKVRSAREKFSLYEILRINFCEKNIMNTFLRWTSTYILLLLLTNVYYTYFVSFQIAIGSTRKVRAPKAAF